MKVAGAMALILAGVISFMVSCGPRRESDAGSGALAVSYRTRFNWLDESRFCGSPKPHLAWGSFSSHPARNKLAACHVVNGLDVLLLFYELHGGVCDPLEFAFYVPKLLSASSEFDVQRIKPEVAQELDRLKSELTSMDLCVVLDDVGIGEYDFDRKGFPLHGHILFSDEVMEHLAFYPDLSTSGLSAARVVNAAADPDGKVPFVMTSVVFDNADDATVLPPFIQVDEAVAERVCREFGRDDRTTGRRTTRAYIVFAPKSARLDRGMWAGVSYDAKEVHGNAVWTVFATEKGTVFGVYPVSKQ